MRFEISRGGSGLTYEIRNIVMIAKKMQEYGLKIIWENIGDPVQKGEKIPDWMKDVLIDILREDASYGYSPTKGIDATRQFIALRTNARGKVQITPEDVIFFNGLGDAIARAYSSIQVDARMIMPEPTYSTHLMAEVLHASFPPNTYRMNPYNNWHPDLRELEQKVRSHRAIVGILIINPDNPTGFVYPVEALENVVRIARENDLFVISDETYINIVYNGKSTVPIGDVIGDVPGIAMKGISKELPWPGARCGWMEVYNAEKDPMFTRFINTILHQKMSEVCSTTLPQLAIPRIMQHPEYKNYLRQRTQHYEKLSAIAYGVLKDVPFVIANKTNGAFYMTVLFNESVLNERQHLHIEHPEVRSYVQGLTKGVEYDKQFVYYLLASTGICVVPLTSFFTPLLGFRMTLLDKDVDEFEFVVKTLAAKVTEYIQSSK
ncbi:MAG: pyridoxal phosphate-dependent aminotransferase [Smithellaceae bacterium]|jgi:aspartate/methionine/tyrosine aminotransferase|nr:pyridoxal phosphate-dependent aminotransferase [Syntrophaceae bacterium]MDD4240479.1 pyridoxal phosphate-dependent aminotransferase [Smithellaceae bacterium]NLX50742.1 pyridoxal phosphate-dependent aminotransferase [Deltaproteobacteria bacterium]